MVLNWIGRRQWIICHWPDGCGLALNTASSQPFEFTANGDEQSNYFRMRTENHRIGWDWISAAIWRNYQLSIANVFVGDVSAMHMIVHDADGDDDGHCLRGGRGVMATSVFMLNVRAYGASQCNHMYKENKHAHKHDNAVVHPTHIRFTPSFVHRREHFLHRFVIWPELRAVFVPFQILFIKCLTIVNCNSRCNSMHMDSIRST